MVTYFISYPIVEVLDVVDSKRKKPKKSEDPGLLALVLITVIPTLLVFGAVAIGLMGIVFGFQASDRLHIGHLKTVHQKAYNGLFTEWDAATGGIHPVSPSAKRTSLAFIILSGLLLALSAVIHCWKRLTRDSDSDA
ncbi:hypothetical protein BDN72DRAFT_898205 [Pluteus cervinus]|uniref:Uncharacterized protein n=1 Tax=Pluteus cervinus TaxID=181527 RepID=A0ACD3AS19_9AGAR|nr:hypothetical protein BDN72DRAFT_898205 [Pluteus cervinus]